MYKLRVYKKTGREKGNLDHEEHFSTFEAMDNRYKELFVYRDFGLNPTAWKSENGEIWTRLLDY